MKFKIDNTALTDEFFEGTVLLGIVAPVKDYLLSWQLNRKLGFQFRLNNEIEIKLTKKKRNYFFSVYEYLVPACYLKHYLYNNQFDGEYLLPEFRHLDFLWLIKDDVFTGEELSGLIQSIKSINGVQLVTELTNEKIKNKEHLVF